MGKPRSVTQISNQFLPWSSERKEDILLLVVRSLLRKMEDAELYSVYNSMQRQTTERIVKEFLPRMHWSNDERVLDVGCGPGDVTTEVLLPRLPTAASLVGVDLSPHMVEFATKKYLNGRVQFKTLDFGQEKVCHFLQKNSYTKLFSFYCLHWIKDQRQMALNINSLLRHGGEFLVIMAPLNQVYKVYRALHQMDRWRTYMQDVNDFIPLLNNSENPCEDFCQVMRNHGLEIMTSEERNDAMTFTNFDVLMRSNEAVNPFVKRMSPEIKQQYMASFRQVVEDLRLCTETDTGEVVTNNPIVVVHGRKP